jgi:hypothetical protein
MLPLMLLGWLFQSGGEDGKGWQIFPGGTNGAGIKKIITDVTQSTCGIALVGLFTGFAVLFLNEVIGVMNGMDVLTTALQNNDSKFLMEGLMFNNSSIINIVFVGIFTGMFMNAIPNLVEKLFQSAWDKGTWEEAEKLRTSIATIGKNAAKGISDKIKALTKPSSGGTP